ncbi:MAG: hypothetical protein ACE5J2_08300 [Nitrososphaerales archaeon]
MIPYDVNELNVRQKISKIGLIIGPVLFVITIYSPIEGLSFEAKVVLGATLWMGSWWITEAIPIYMTALLPLVIFPLLNIAQLGETSMIYADRIVFLFLGGGALITYLSGRSMPGIEALMQLQ